MKQIFHARKQRQLRHLVKKLKRLSNDSKRVVQNEVDLLIRKIKTLARELSQVLTPFHLKRMLGPAAFILGASFCNLAMGQSFAAPLTNPFGLTQVSEVALPAFADIDGDGDVDLFVGDTGDYDAGIPPQFNFFENTGTANNPQFASPVANPFGLSTTMYTIAVPIFTDLDGDVDIDMLITGYATSGAGTFIYFENTGTPNAPQFAAPVVNPFGMAPGSDYISLPSFVDLDGDGDTDLVAIEYYGDTQYFENIGTAINPQFAAPVSNPFGLLATSSEYLMFPAFADLDKDGDMDLIAGQYPGDIAYSENTGTAMNPEFAAPVSNPFGLSSVMYYAIPTLADLDGDGDMDLLVGEYGGNMQYFENTSSVATQEQNLSIELKIQPNPVSSELSISTDMPFEKIEVFDVLGKLIRVYDGYRTTVNVADWSSGAYLLKFMDANGGYVSRRILKE